METFQTYWVLTIVLQSVSMISVWYLCWKYARLRHQKENEYYTDYRHNNLILRIYKPEFEYQAIGSIPRDKLLDQGVFSQYYMWALIEK